MTNKEWDVIEDKLIDTLAWLAAPSIMYYFHIKKHLSYFWRGVAVVFCTLPILMITFIPLNYNGNISIWYVNLWRILTS
jgi:hypothetical protein